MNPWAAGAIGGGAAMAVGVLGFYICRWKWPRGGSLIDGGAIIGVLFGFPIGYVVGLVGALVAARALGGPYHVLPALALGLLPFALLALSVFLLRKRIR